MPTTIAAKPRIDRKTDQLRLISSTMPSRISRTPAAKAYLLATMLSSAPEQNCDTARKANR